MSRPVRATFALRRARHSHRCSGTLVSTTAGSGGLLLEANGASARARIASVPTWRCSRAAHNLGGRRRHLRPAGRWRPGRPGDRLGVASKASPPRITTTSTWRPSRFADNHPECCRGRRPAVLRSGLPHRRGSQPHRRHRLQWQRPDPGGGVGWDQHQHLDGTIVEFSTGGPSNSPRPAHRHGGEPHRHDGRRAPSRDLDERRYLHPRVGRLGDRRPGRQTLAGNGSINIDVDAGDLGLAASVSAHGHWRYHAQRRSRRHPGSNAGEDALLITSGQRASPLRRASVHSAMPTSTPQSARSRPATRPAAKS